MQVEAQPEAKEAKSGDVAGSETAEEGATQASGPGPAQGPAQGPEEAQPTTPTKAASAGKQASVKTRTPAQREGQAPAGQDLVAAGERYLYGRGVARDCNQALVYFREGAELQNAQALSRLGAMYATGVCVSQDRVVAYNWFSRALAEDRSNQAIEQNLNMLWRDMSARERQQVLQVKAR
jgi:TPR repeat protein